MEIVLDGAVRFADETSQLCLGQISKDADLRPEVTGWSSFRPTGKARSKSQRIKAIIHSNRN